MASSRLIKPDFWTDGTMIGLPFEARLFYIGTWNFACNRGHIPDDPSSLKLKILPGDPVDAFALVQSLVDTGRLARIESPDGRPFLHIVRFEDHQKVDARWNSRCPACAPPNSPKLTGVSDNSPNLPDKRGGGGSEEKRSKGEDHPATPFCSKHPEGTDAPCRACKTARLKFEAELLAAKNKPTTPGIVTDPDCPKHPNRPARDCDRCAEEAVA